ncbi:USH1C [Lepeophtheirus salmonis]|uniref:USH1C n=1 Tax=Lepeophtheirus salmonis TaxID=72036 RepID=A0A7R8H7F3_LEPSM|nr:USH1C [Lepeophtheirus salmonis]CAF2922220.1 USH1C [Lepeophtheirus salmonis]
MLMICVSTGCGFIKMSSSTATTLSSSSTSSSSNHYRHRTPPIKKDRVEHGLGHYVSGVDPGGEAHSRGLRIGDQILSVCGLPLVRTTHKEVVSLISGRRKIELEVKSVGLIPCKIRKGDPITWKSVVEIHHPDKTAVPIVGPPDRPGVFVQSISNNGIAWKSGLRIGDQILCCNGVEFNEFDDFSRVIRVMKSSKLLHLFVRKNAGKDFLISGSLGNDSSGYDSTDEKPQIKEEEEPEESRQDVELEALKKERRRLELVQKEREEIQRLKDERNELGETPSTRKYSNRKGEAHARARKVEDPSGDFSQRKGKVSILYKTTVLSLIIQNYPHKAAIALMQTLVSAIQSEIQRRTLRKSSSNKGYSGSNNPSGGVPPPPPPPQEKRIGHQQSSKRESRQTD